MLNYSFVSIFLVLLFTFIHFRFSSAYSKKLRPFIVNSIISHKDCYEFAEIKYGFAFSKRRDDLVSTLLTKWSSLRLCLRTWRTWPRTISGCKFYSIIIITYLFLIHDLLCRLFNNILVTNDRFEIINNIEFYLVM